MVVPRRSAKGGRRYSRECENSDDADAALHAYLNNATGHARAILERALAQIITAEEIEL